MRWTSCERGDPSRGDGARGEWMPGGMGRGGCSNKRLAIYKGIRHKIYYIKDSRNQVSHCQRKNLKIWKGRTRKNRERVPCGMGLKLEVLCELTVFNIDT